jgi:hypothetical protein
VLRTSSCVIALNAMMAAISMTAQAADDTLTLACKGTVTEDAKPEPISMGIIANFTNRTVQGFEDLDFPVKITGVNEVTVSFLGERLDVTNERFEGSIDRVTGAVNAYYTMMNLHTGGIVYSIRYVLKCRPAQRMF